MLSYVIPITPGAPQSFGISLNGVNYQMTIRWNATPNGQGGWYFDLSDIDKGIPVLGGIPIITGADLLGQYGHLGIGGGLVCISDSGEPPEFNEIGAGSVLYFVTGERDA